MTILIYAEYDNEKQKLKETSQATINAALLLKQKLAPEAFIDIILFTNQPLNINKRDFSNIRKIFFAIGENYEQQLTHIVAPLLIKLASEYNYIIAPNSSNGRDIIPLIAAEFGVAQISDIIDIIDKNIFKRPIYTGNAIATIKAKTEKILLTIRNTAFTQTIDADTNENVVIEEISIIENDKVKPVIFCSQHSNKQKDADLQSAKIVVSGGHGLQSSENFTNILGPLAKTLGAALGATRAAVDAGFAPNDWQIGQTGKIVSPKLYIAVGLSGAQQHIAGMKDSQTIIAINLDSEEPIVKIADYALIGDLFEVVPQLNKKLR